MAGTLTGQLQDDLRLLDVLPLSLGIEILGKKKQSSIFEWVFGERHEAILQPIIKRNAAIPCEGSSKVITAPASEFTVKILEGDERLAAQNRIVQEFQITINGSELPQIEVTLRVDQNSKLHVRLKNVRNQQQSEVIIPNNTLNLSMQKLVEAQ